VRAISPRPLLWSTIVGLAGCPQGPEALDPVGTWTPPEAGVSTDALPTSGAVPLSVVVRNLDAWGAAVPGAALDVTVGAASESVALDGAGVGVVSVEDVGWTDVSVGSSTAAVFGVEAATDLSAPPSGFAPEPLIEALPVAGGAIGRSATTLWWLPAGGRPVPVLRPPTPRTLEGFAVGHLDEDGLTDAIAWSADTVVVLRGHSLAGLVKQGSIVAANRVVGAATVADADADDVADLAIAWTSDQQHELEIWRGDGAWGFSVAEPLKLRRHHHSISVGDNTGEGRAQVTLLDDESLFWTRYVVSTDSWALTGPTFQDQVAFPPGATSFSGDYNGDGAQELFIAAPLGTGEREVQMFDLTPNTDASTVQYVRFTPFAAYLALADSDRDGRDDVWMLNSELDLFQRKRPADEQLQRRVMSSTEHGPIAVRDLTGDDVPEVLVAGPTRLHWTWGGLAIQDGADWWVPSEPATSFDVGLASAPVVTELDGDDTTVDVAALTDTAAGLRAVVFALLPGSIPVFTEVGSHVLAANGSDGVDLAVCGARLYALSTTDLVRVDVSGANLTRGGRAAGTGQRVACGAGPGGAVVGVLDAGQVRLYDASLSLLTTVPASGAGDLALVDGALATCEGDCDVVAWDDGTGEVAVSAETDGLTIGSDAPIAHVTGRISVQDVDGDGLDDLLVYGDEAVSVIRATSAGYGLDRVYHTTLALEGPVFAVDVLNVGRTSFFGRQGTVAVGGTGYVGAP
jgi:hypothetical protein